MAKDQSGALKNNPSVEIACKLRAEKLHPRQIGFVLNYAGDPAEAAIKAGYKHEATGFQLLKIPAIMNAIIARDQAMDKLPKSTDPIIDVQQLRQWWTENIVDTDLPMGIRVRCSELLAKSYGTFCEKLIVENHETKEQTITIKFAGPENNFLKDRRRKAIDVTPKVTDTTPVD